jgi:polyketide biosynthesis acyl carrier protein
VHSAITTILPGLDLTDIEYSRHLADLGADSIDRVEIILTIIDRLGLHRPLSDFSGIPTIADLIDHVCGAQA